MSFSGNVSSMSLDEVINFLATNALEGQLSVQSGDDASLRLFFKDGLIFFPYTSRRGTYRLSRILRQTGILSREGLDSYLTELSARKKELEAQEDSEEVQAAKRAQFTEEIHDLFLWGDARFEFLPGPWPRPVEQDRQAGRGLIIETTSLLMEVARRADERRRIRSSIPSSRVVLHTKPGSDQVIVKALIEVGVELRFSPFDGTLRLDDVLERWGIAHHTALAAVSELVEAGHLVPLTREETQARLEKRLEGGDVEGAARLLGHWFDLDQLPPDRFDLGPLARYADSPRFEGGKEVVSSFRLEGPRLFALLRRLVERGCSFTVLLHYRGWEKRIAALPGEIFLLNEGRPEPGTPELEDYLFTLGFVKKKQLKAIKSGELALPKVVQPKQIQQALLAKLIDEVSETALWVRPDVELRTRCVKGERGPQALNVGLGPKQRTWLLKGLEQWANVFQRVPGENPVYVAGPRARAKDPAGRFFKRFSLARNVGELRAKAQATPLEFAKFVEGGLNRGYLRDPQEVELKHAFEQAEAQGNDIMAYRLALAGQALGFRETFDPLVDAFRQASVALPEPYPALEGDLDGVGLAAVLQALRSQRRTGTLTVSADRREEKLYFARGDAYFLRVKDKEADEFVAFFLGDDGAESMSELDSKLEANEDELEGAEMQALKDQFLEALFWEGSTFAFFQNNLPKAFFNPEEGASKVALHTDRFLLSAIQSMNQWEQIVEVTQGIHAIFEFTQPTGKLEAIRDEGHPEVLTLIDGWQSFDDLVRISGLNRLEVGQLLSKLVSSDRLRVCGTKKKPEPAELPDAIPD